MARLVVIALAALCLAAAPAAGLDSRRNGEDFDALWRAIDGEYAHGPGSRAAWRKARTTWRARATRAKTRGEFLLALEGALAHLHDDAVSIGERDARSARLVPSETDAWAEWRDGKAVVTAVRTFSEADVAGLHPGHVITHVQGVPIERAVRERMRETGASGVEARNWALRHFLAGPRAGVLRLGVTGPEGTKTLEIERAAGKAANGPPIIARRMGEERDIGYIRIKDVLGDARLPAQVDGALHHLSGTRALILDLRETETGGEPHVTEALRTRFAQAARREKLVVLVDRWTAGEGEALAMALQAAAGATLIGTRTAGLRGALKEVRLPHSGLAVRFPARREEAVRPNVEIDLMAPSGGPGDPILYQALKWLAPSPARAGRISPR